MKRWIGSFVEVCVVLATVLASFPARGAAIAPPRRISEAEREAVRIAADYLDRGPAAFHDALASTSPLRSIGPAAALEEIEVRAGGRNDVRWELRTPQRHLGDDVAIFEIESPSGLDDTLLVRMVYEDGRWRVLWLRSFHEPWRDGRASAVAETTDQGSVPSTGTILAVAVAGALAAALLLLVGISFLPEKPVPALVWALPGILILALTALALAGRLPIPGMSRGAPELLSRIRRGTDVGRLGKLLPLRRRLEAGEPRDPASCLALALKHPEPTAQLWITQRLMATAALADAHRVLSQVKEDPPTPFLAVLRARLAFLEKHEAEAGAAYETAARQGVSHDGILLEALAVARALGQERPDVEQEAALAGFGARSADARLVLASGFALSEKRGEAEEALLSAFHERPLDREELFSDDDLHEVLHHPAVLKVLDLSSAQEPSNPSDEMGRRTVIFPAAAQVRVCGRALRATIGTSRLNVPGGAGLAAAGTPAEDAGAERRALMDRALAEVPALLDEPPQVGAFVQPVLRRRILMACYVLARRGKWNEVVQLTSRLSGRDDQVPADVLMLRAQSLRRAGRPDEAKQLLVDLAASPGFVKRNDPMELYKLGELFDGLEEYDLALRCLEQASVRLRREALLERIAQVRTERALALKFATATSAHFEVRFPPERKDGFGEEATRVLEAERKRMSKWLPAADSLKTTVQVLWLEEFRRTYGASGDFLGVYDGKIRVPLAGVWRFGPFAVSIVTHELAHALAASLTNDHAPTWFQEGLAQHIEMRPNRQNDIAQYHKDGSLLSLPVVETILERMPDSYFVEQAYQESAWAVAYLDAKFGTAGLQKLMAAYREGLSGDEALKKALGVDLAQLSRGFVAWSLKQPPVLHDQIVAYDDTPDDSFHWSKDPKAPLGSKPPVDVPDSLRD